MEYELILSKKSGACVKATITDDDILNRDMNQALRLLMKVVEDQDGLRSGDFVLRKIED